jgi:hypothetical protein
VVLGAERIDEDHLLHRRDGARVIVGAIQIVGNFQAAMAR